MKVLITGATGFIGSHLTYFLLQEQGVSVSILKRKNCSLDKLIKTFNYYTNDSETLLKKIEWVDGDVLNKKSLEKATKNVNHIYHLAGKVSVNGNGKKEMLQINVEGTINLLQAAISNHVERFCYVSSISVYNKGSKKNYYAKTKELAEKYIWNTTPREFEPLIVYPSVVIGPGNGKNGFEKILNSLWHGNIFYTSGGAEFVDVKDVTGAMIKLMQNTPDNKRFILSSGYHSYKSILQTAAKNLGTRKPFVPVGCKTAKILSFIDKTISLFINKEPLLTDESLHLLFNKSKVRYGKGEVPPRLNMPYTPVAQSIAEASRYYKQLH